MTSRCAESQVKAPRLSPKAGCQQLFPAFALWANGVWGCPFGVLQDLVHWVNWNKGECFILGCHLNG